jgi:hypothetical protein
MGYDYKEQQERNRQALSDPKPGDYWHEMFCPYFIVVDRGGDDITVLSCLGGPDKHSRKDEPDARVDNDDGTWSFDYSKSMVVDRAWIERTVKYGSIDGFVADVTNTEKSRGIVDEWRDWRQKDMLREIEQKKQAWEEFTGWKYLKQE